MCIRDRLEPECESLAPPLRLPPRLGPEARRHSRQPDCVRLGAHAHPGAPGPVSYTHLTLPTICSV
eukprot:8460277-Alexandrium_andersonii.AAC.1